MYKNILEGIVEVEPRWYSEFPPRPGVETMITAGSPIVAVASYDSLTGGHAALYLEEIDTNGDAIMTKIHLTGQELGSGMVLTGKSKGVDIRSEESGFYFEIAQEIKTNENTSVADRRGDIYLYQSWMISPSQAIAVKAAARRFNEKIDRGRYTYRTAGGMLGWLSTKPGTRGINCADFVIKILKEAGIKNISNQLFNTPRRITGA